MESSTFEVNNKPQGKQRALRYTKLAGVILLGLIMVILLINAFLSLVIKDYKPKVFGYSMISIVTDSMKPTIKPGSVIFSKAPTDAPLERGDVITFKLSSSAGNMLITHRIVSVNETADGFFYTTKGDNVALPDDGAVAHSDVIAVFSGGKIIGLGYLLSFTSSYYGFLCLVFIFISVALMYILNAVLERNEKSSSKKKEIFLKVELLLTDMRTKNGDTPELKTLDYALNLLTADSKQFKNPKTQEVLNEYIQSDSLLLPESMLNTREIEETEIVKVNVSKKVIEEVFSENTNPSSSKKSHSNSNNKTKK